MKIGVHSQVLTEQNLYGIGSYTYNLLNALAQIDVKNEYCLIANRPIQHRPTQSNFEPVLATPSHALTYLGFPSSFKENACELAFIPKEVTPFRVKAPVVLTVFDIYFLKCDPEIRKQVPFSSLVHYYLAAKVHFKRADRILCISEDTKNDLVEVCGLPPDKIVVTALGYDPTVFHEYGADQIDQVKEKYNLRRPYFINNSSVWWKRKNQIRILEAFYQLKSKRDIPHQMVFVGKPGASYQEMLHFVKSHGLEKDVFFFNFIPIADLPLLLNGAEALVFPSLHEGFGLPIVEAMACGCPVITSNISAMPEVAGEAGVLVDPLDNCSIEKAMGDLIENTVLKKNLIREGLKRSKLFSWNATAQKTLEVFESLL